LTDEECRLLNRRSAQYKAALAAVRAGLADGLPATGRLDWVNPWEDDFDAFANVLADRRPPWLAELVGQQLEAPAHKRHLDPRWLAARRLVRLGAIARPAVPGYTTLMPRALYQELWVRHPAGRQRPGRRQRRIALLAAAHR
jgi:hypothetical protein